MTGPLPLRIAWFAPWTWKRSIQIGLILGMGCIAIVTATLSVLIIIYANHAID